MVDKLSDPIGRLMGLRYKSHPWHGISIGDHAPEEVTAFIEVVPKCGASFVWIHSTNLLWKTSR